MGNPLAEYGYGTGEKVTIEHVLILTVPSAWEKPLQRALVAWGECSKGTLKSLQILGYAASAYLVMLGASRLVESFRSNKKRIEKDGDGGDK